MKRYLLLLTLAVSAKAQWVNTGGHAFGDSTCTGQYSENKPGAGDLGFPHYLNTQVPGGVTVHCENGAYMTDVNQLQLFPLGPLPASSNPAFFLNVGLDDRRYTTAAQQTMDQQAHLAGLFWMLIPTALHVQPTATNGFVVNNTRIGALAPTLESHTNGAKLPLTIQTEGGPVVIWFEQVDGNLGEADVNIDGRDVGTLNSGNSGAADDCICTHNLLNNSSPLAQYFPEGLDSITWF